jgi:hypothetical protein
MRWSYALPAGRSCASPPPSPPAGATGLEYTLVYCGVQVGLAGPLGLLRQHELRDYAQRMPDCHDYLALRRAGLAWDLRLPHQLPQRPELRKLDTLPHSPCIAPPLMGTIST